MVARRKIVLVRTGLRGRAVRMPLRIFSTGVASARARADPAAD
jgi:hypothetical protein